MPDIAFQCSSCQQPLIVDSAGAGLEIFCPGCGATLRVPLASQEQFTPAPAPSPEISPPSLPPAKKRSSQRREPRTSAPSKPPTQGGARAHAAPSVLPPPAQTKTDPSIEIAELRSKLDRAHRELDAANAARRQLEEQVQHSSATLAKSDARAKEDAASLRARMRAENDRLRQECERSAQENHALGEKLKEVENLRIQAEIRLAETSSSLENKLAEAQATAAAQLSDLRTRSESEIQRLKKDADRRSQEATSLIGRIKEVEASRDASESALAQTKAELEQANSGLTSHKEALASLEYQNQELQSSASAAANAAEESIRDLNERLGAASSKIGELEAALDVGRRALNKAEALGVELTRKLEASEQTASRLRTDLEHSQAQGAALTRDLNIAREESAKSRQERALMRSEREATRAEANRLRREVHEAIDRLQRTTSIKDRLEEDLREAMAELEGFRSGDMVRENKVLKGIIERRNVEAQKEREEMVRSRKRMQSLHRWVVLLMWVAGFSLIAAIIEAVLLWANLSPS